MRTQETTKKSRRGRPKGSPNREVDVVTAQPTRCKKCGSPERSAYINRRTMEVGGIEPDGRRYRRVVWRRCQCLKCGQWRDDVSHEA